MLINNASEENYLLKSNSNNNKKANGTNFINIINNNSNNTKKKTSATSQIKSSNKISSKSTSSLSSTLFHLLSSNKPNLNSKTNTMTSTNGSSSSTSTFSSNQHSNGSKQNLQQQITNGLFIRKEIQRFESVHPNIYSVYDLIDSIQDFNLQQQIREHIVNIEDSFVNSQEWTLSRSVPDLKLGVLGSTNSGKSSLVHRFLTGTYIQEESPEGGRFKKEVIIDGQSYLLLIRDEGGAPEMQFTHWVDAVIFVFSLESEESFLTAHQFYLKMQHYRNMTDVPFILVGTQDYISESNPRVIDDSRARNLAYELKKSCYYETCATYGLHVERVFHDACQKVVNHRSNLLLNQSCLNNNRPSTPLQSQQQTGGNNSSSIRLLAGSHVAPSSNVQLSSASTSSLNHNYNHSHNQPMSAISSVVSAAVGINGYNSSTNTSPLQNQQSSSGSNTPQFSSTTSNSNMAFFMANPHLVNPILIAQSNSNLLSNHQQNGQTQSLPHAHVTPNNIVFKEPFSIINHQSQSHMVQQAAPASIDLKQKNNLLGFNSTKDIHLHPENSNSNQTNCQNSNNNNNVLITPCSTPNQKRKDTNRRRSNLFTPNKKEDKQNKLNDMGVGRSIPIKQGFLYKKTNSTINKDWKKKFVTLNDDGSLRYYPSMNDYMDDVHGKEIDLQKTTVKIPGAYKPRIGKSLIPSDTIALSTQKLNQDINSLNLNSNSASQFDSGSKSQFYDDTSLNGFNSVQHQQPVSNQNENNLISSTTSSNNYLARIDINSKKRHRRIKSNHKSDQNNQDEQEGFEFVIVSLDNKQWHFEAASNEEREEWVQAVEQQILSSLQLNETNRLKTKHGGFTADNVTILTMKSVPGNNACADCDAPNPVWASLNHGSLICIECSGIHRNLGTHLSRVRSLELDDWSNDLIQIMTAIGNKMINSVYEANSKSFGRLKPNSNTPREEKEKWIRAKYESKLFLAQLANKDVSVAKQLMDAVGRQDIQGVILCLAHCKPEDVNSSLSQSDKRTSLHIAASLANLVILQLLIWYGADVELTDSQGRNALAYSRSSNSSECSQLLIHNGCTENHGLVATLNRKSHSSASTSQILNGMQNYDKLSFANTNVI